MQNVLNSPNVLVCVGREPFKPILSENVWKSPSEQLPGLSSRSQASLASESTDSKTVSFGLKAKKSVIHPRSASSNRTRFSLSSEKSYTNGLNISPINSRCASFSKPKESYPSHSLMNDDIEKRVHVNKDGSLSVEMKVRFHLLNNETLQWSTQIKKSGAVKQENGDHLCVYAEKEDQIEGRQVLNPETLSETDDSFYPCDADSYSSKPNEAEDDDMYCNNCGKQCQDYDIWKNPIHASRPVDVGMSNAWCAESSGSSASSHRRVIHKQKTSVESIRTTTSEEYTEHFVQQSSRYSKVVESCNSQMGCCIANHCGSRTSLSTATSSEGPSEETDRSHGDLSTRKSPPNDASISKTHNTIECQDPIELLSQGFDSDLQTCSSGCVEPSGEQKSESVTNMTNHDRQDSYISESSIRTRKSKRKRHKTNSAHSRSLSSNHSLRNTGINEDSRRPPSGNSICSVKEDCCDSDKISSIKAESSSLSAHNDSTLTSVSVKTMMSEYETWSTEGQSKSSDKERDMQVEDSDGICPAEQYESVQQQCQMHTLTTESTALLATDMDDLCECKTKSHESSSEHSVSGASTHDISTGNQRPHSGNSKGEKCGSDLCVSNLPSNKEINNVSFGSLVSRQSSKSELFGSKDECISRSGVERLQSTSSGVSSNSEPKNGAAEAGSVNEEAFSKPSTTPSSGRASSRATPGNCDRASVSKTASLTSMHSPSPPKDKPQNKSRSSKLKHSSTGSIHKEPAYIVEDLRECPDNSRPSTSPAKSIISKGNSENDIKTSTGMDIQNSDQNMTEASRQSSTSSSKKKAKLEIGVACTQIEGAREIIPSSLPNITAEEVVHEWLKNIPSETLVIEYGAEHEITEEAAKKALNCEGSQVAQSAEDVFAEEATTKKHSSDPVIEAISTCETSTTNTDSTLMPEEIITQENCNDNCLECIRSSLEEREISGFEPSRNNTKNALPGNVHTSVQIMKALFSSQHAKTFDRSNSLPEVSPTMGQKLSNSAKVLITCLAGLNLLDDPMDPKDKLRGVNHNRYIELMNIFQALWIGGPVDVERLNVDKSTKQNPTMTSKSHRTCSMDAEPTPASSSGVDVNSGSGGSGDGSMAGNGDSTLINEKPDDCKSIFLNTKAEDTIKSHQEPNMAGTPERDHMTYEVKEEIASNEESSGISSPNTATDNVTHCEAQCNDYETNKTNDVEGNINERNEINDVEGNMNETHMEDNINLPDETELERNTIVVSHGEDNAKCEMDCPVSNDGADNVVNLGSNEEEKNDPNTSRSQDTTESNSQSDCQTTVYFISESHENNESAVNREAFTDPVWILKLLKKIETEFMTHYVDAMNEFKVRWNLEDNENLNEMIAELKNEVEKRIQKSVEKELARIQSRAGNKFPRPPKGRQRHTQQTEQRRKRLQSMHKKSVLNDLNMAQNRQMVSNDISLETDEEDLTFSASLADEISADDDFCPCETCIRKKLAFRTLRPNTLASNAPIVRAFDLREILRIKKEERPVSRKNSNTDYQDSLALQNGPADDNGNEKYAAEPDDMVKTGANMTVKSEQSEEDNSEKYKETEFQEQENEQNSDLQTEDQLVNFSQVNEKGENDLIQGKEENTKEEKEEPAAENKSQHETDQETDIEAATDDKGTEDDIKEGGEVQVAGEQISEEEIIAEGEKKAPDLENPYLESALCGNEDNGENHTLIDTFAQACDSDSRTDCHEQVKVEADENDESTDDKNDETTAETTGSPAEELDEMLKENLNDSQMEKVGSNEGCDAEEKEDMANSSIENMEECKAEDTNDDPAEELDLSTKEAMGDGTAEESNETTASAIDENKAEDNDHGQIESGNGGITANEENDSSPTLNIEECTTVETCGDPGEDESSSAEKKENNTEPAEEEGGGTAEEQEDSFTAKENNEDEEGNIHRTTAEEEDDFPVESDGLLARDLDSGIAEKKDDGLSEDINDGTTDKVDGSTLGEDHVPTEDINENPAEDVDDGTTDKVDGSTQEEDHVPTEDINENPAEDVDDGATDKDDLGPQEDDHVPTEDINENPAEDVDDGATDKDDSGPQEDDHVPTEDINENPAEDVDDGVTDKDDSGPQEDDHVPTEDINENPAEGVDDGATDKDDSGPQEDDHVPTEDINENPAEGVDDGATDKDDSGPQEDIDGELTDVMEDAAGKEDIAVPPDNINDSPAEDINGGSAENEDIIPQEVICGGPTEDIEGVAAENDAGILKEINSGSAEDINGGGEEDDAGPVEEINGVQAEDIGSNVEDKNDDGQAEVINDEQADTMHQDESEQIDGSPVEHMPENTEQDTKIECQDLDTVNGNATYGNCDMADSKTAQMYPDSSSEEEDRDSACNSPVASNNGSSLLKKSNGLQKHSIELDDLDF